MSDSRPGWAAVVVNYDGGAMLFEALASIDAQSVPAAEKVVIDNGSKPAELAAIRQHHPSWRVVELGGNYGFAHGANRGIAETTAPWIALVNNDVTLDAAWAERLLERIESDENPATVARSLPAIAPNPPAPPQLAALQGAVFNRDGTEVDTLGITLDETISAIPVGIGADPRRVLESGVFDIRGPSATAALYRRESLRAAAGREEGAFPWPFFAWYEDVDLGFRFWRLGLRVLCEPKATARHRGSVTGDRTPRRRRRLLARNRIWTLRRNLAPEAMTELANEIRHADRRAVTTATLQAGLAGMRGALEGLREGKKDEPPADPIDAPKLGLLDLQREMFRGRSLGGGGRR